MVGWYVPGILAPRQPLNQIVPLKLGRPLRYLVFSLMALIGDPIHEYFSKGFRGQPSKYIEYGEYDYGDLIISLVNSRFYLLKGGYNPYPDHTKTGSTISGTCRSTTTTTTSQTSPAKAGSAGSRIILFAAYISVVLTWQLLGRTRKAAGKSGCRLGRENPQVYPGTMPWSLMITIHTTLVYRKMPTKP